MINVLCSVFLVSLAQLLLKFASINLHTGSLSDVLLRPDALFAAPVFALLGGLICYAVSMLFWFFALRRVPLGKAYAVLSLSYPAVWLAAQFIPAIAEPFLWRSLVGVVLIVSGVVIIFSDGSGIKSRPSALKNR
ncbi:4-amino-4-deoxy-L-arabinose-phosphoundecaprenol flippase subunit ArnF [Atlantibacter sp.]|uniref:4-amino-4-deoxy-L-arabinose-phosphoundecaprenol flippase subunit ArnF n=1 Tax=Atlantibacter sp. TaxID=1903473 RepID=UPI003917DFF4